MCKPYASSYNELSLHFKALTIGLGYEYLKRHKLCCGVFAISSIYNVVNLLINEGFLNLHITTYIKILATGVVTVICSPTCMLQLLSFVTTTIYNHCTLLDALQCYNIHTYWYSTFIAS